MESGHGLDDFPLKGCGDIPAGPSGEAVDAASVCPSCSYASGSGSFETCPRCGLIIRKYRRSHDLVVPQALPESRRCPKCGDETGAGALFCPHCGEPASGGAKGFGGLRSAIVATAACLTVIVAASLLFRQSNESLISSSVETAHKNDAVPGERPPARPEAAGAAPSSAPAADEPVSTAIPYAISNSVGISRAEVIFASGMGDYSTVPATTLRRVSMKDKRVVAHVKVLIPPDQSYQIAGKMYDAAGTLVLNISNQARPTNGIWHWWYYHDFDKAFEKEGTWKFVFFVNGQQITEDQIEVSEL